MQSKLEQKMNFSKTIYNDPIKLLKATKEHALNLQETTYSMEIIDDTIVHFLLMKQKEESLHKYIKKFKTAKEATELHLGGPIILTKYMKTLED